MLIFAATYAPELPMVTRLSVDDLLSTFSVSWIIDPVTLNQWNDTAKKWEPCAEYLFIPTLPDSSDA